MRQPSTGWDGLTHGEASIRVASAASILVDVFEAHNVGPLTIYGPTSERRARCTNNDSELACLDTTASE